ncbi:TPA: hypothetical protein ACJHIK_002294, partial [Staphylococcus pseudintermedius]
MNIEKVLNMIKEQIEGMSTLIPEYLKNNRNDNGFEELFPIVANNIANKLLPNDILEIEPRLGHHFPDVDLILNGLKYGIELKSRSNGAWSTNGNSVLESITNDDYEEIYLFFGTKIPDEQRLLVKFAPYWQTTKSIKVTHSPRFIIDISETQTSIFKKKEDYDRLRNLDEKGKVRFLQEYLKSNTDGTKWYITPDEPNLPLNFSELSRKKRDELRAELFLLFPSDFLGRNKGDYTRATLHLIKHHYVYSTSLRDKFSASGKFEHNGYRFPRVYSSIKEISLEIVKIINEASEDFISLLYTTWKNDGLISSESPDTLKDYRFVIDKIMSESNNLEIVENLKKAKMYPLSSYLFDM